MGIFRFKNNSQGRKGSETPNEEALYCQTIGVFCMRNWWLVIFFVIICSFDMIACKKMYTIVTFGEYGI